MKKYLILIIPLLTCRLAFAQSIPEQNESFNPMTLNEPSLPILDGTIVYEIVTDITEQVKNPVKSDTVRLVEKMGWKVQIFSTDDFYWADSVYQNAMYAFTGEDVEKVFNSPCYKIRVGNCLTREEAETLLKRAEALKYQESWIIHTKIKTKEGIIFY